MSAGGADVAGSGVGGASASAGADGDDGTAAGAAAEGAWNPGLGSAIPLRLQPKVTLFRPENAFLGHAEASELAEISGIPAIELASLRPERLITHELLVRVTADYTVRDGPNYADLGISLRSMVARLQERHVEPELEALRAAYDEGLERARACIDAELAERIFGPETDGADGAGARGGAVGGDGDTSNASGGGAAPKGGALRRALGRLFGGAGGDGATRARAARAAAPSRPHERPEMAALAAWREELGGGEPEPLRRECLAALVRGVDGIVSRRGRLVGDRDLVRRIALLLVGNAHGAALLGERLAPIVARGAEAEGYRLLPAQRKPVVMNVKGASASGKSTIRPRQRELAAKLELPWEDFALISPDYWRKYLLDYESLGDDHRYGAMLCGQELEIVDRKLDRHMEAKARRGEISHLLIDRFRFDSFTLERDRTAADSRLLSRFGDRIFLFFVVTSPIETVERAWVRGRRTGRYKAVSDLLHHNIEAFTGMPALFLSWASGNERRVHFEFLDNDVPEEELPRTAAFGWNDEMTILDVGLMRSIDRHRCIDVDAGSPEEVRASTPDADATAPTFVRRCAERIARIDFADRDTAEIYARVENGTLTWCDEAALARRDDRDAVRAVLAALGTACDAADGEAPAPMALAHERHVTVGRWAEAAAADADDATGGYDGIPHNRSRR